MSLDTHLRDELQQAIQNYDFPCVTFDFKGAREIIHPSMREVEAEIRNGLLADEPDSIRDSLSNVLYWGYARTGYRWNRVNRFRENVTQLQLLAAGQVFRDIQEPGVQQIAHLELPEFSGLSFVSKVRMFLDPTKYVVLDRQLLKLREQDLRTIFSEVVMGPKETSIRVSNTNTRVYERWSKQCRMVATEHFNGEGMRAVEVERGIFHLVQTQQAHIAAEILSNI